MGFFSGYIPNSTAMIASQAPKDKSGYALGTLATAMVSGTLIGPSLGGLLAEWFGMANVFLIVGALLALATLLTIFFVHETLNQLLKVKCYLVKKLLIKSVTNKFFWIISYNIYYSNHLAIH